MKEPSTSRPVTLQGDHEFVEFGRVHSPQRILPHYHIKSYLQHVTALSHLLHILHEISPASALYSVLSHPHFKILDEAYSVLINTPLLQSTFYI